MIAHRGASAAHPENTVPAFVAAHPLGADGVELDVRRAADGELVVHHDARYSDGQIVAEIPAAGRPGQVPTLAEAVEAATPCWLNVEIKNLPHEPGFDPAEATAAAVTEWARAARPAADLLFSAFTPPTLTVVRRTDPGAATALLLLAIDDPRRCAEQAAADGHAALHPSDRVVTPELVDIAHAVGLVVNVWTVDAPHRIVELAEWGVDGIVTNMPDVAASALGRPPR